MMKSDARNTMRETTPAAVRRLLGGLLVMMAMCLSPMGNGYVADVMGQDDDTGGGEQVRDRGPRGGGDSGFQRPRGPRDGRDGPHEMSDQELDEAIAVLRDYDREMAERVEQWRQSRPDTAEPTMFRRLPWLRRAVYYRRTDVERYQLFIEDLKMHRETEQLRTRLMEAGDTPPKALIDEAMVKIRVHFDVRQRLRELELRRLEERVEEVRGQLEVRRNMKDELVQQRLDDLRQGERRPQW